MKLRIILLFTLFTICACNNSTEKKVESSKSLHKEKTPNNNHKPLFLGLSPYMSDRDFEKQIGKLERQGDLREGLFYLDAKVGFDFTFAIHKTNYSIRLWTRGGFQRHFDTLDGWRKLISENEDTKDDLLEMYSKKYKRSKIQLPNNFRSTSFGINNKSYTLFEDDEKYVLIGYTISPSIEEVKKKFSKTEHSLNIETNRNEFEEFLEIQIDYFERDVLDNILSSTIPIEKISPQINDSNVKIDNREKI